MIINRISPNRVNLLNIFLSSLFGSKSTSILKNLHSGNKFSGLTFKRNY